MNITIDLDIKKIPLEDFMQAIGCQPINRLGNLIVYKPPYVKDAKPTFIINKTKNQWTDTTTGAKGGIYELAYKLIGTANMSELNMYIAGEMTALRKIKNKLNKYTKPLGTQSKIEQSNAKRKMKLSLR